MTPPTLTSAPPPAAPSGLDLPAQLDRLAADRDLVAAVARVVYHRDQDQDGAAAPAGEEHDLMTRDLECALVELGRRVRQAAAEYAEVASLINRVHTAAEETRAARNGVLRGHVLTNEDVQLLDQVLARVPL